MSDRLAVFRSGRIDQIGTPAEVYENPATAFVADFVGISNLVHGPDAQAITGSPAPFTIRPEKIRMLAADVAPGPGDLTVDGTIQDVVYLGMHTRYRVTVTTGAVLTVVAQNREAAAGDVQALRGHPVRLSWPRDQGRPVENRS